MPFTETTSYNVKEQIVVGALIRNLRKEKKMSAADVSAFSGISTQYLTEIEKGTKKQSLVSLEAVFETLGVKFNYDSESVLKYCEDALERVLDLNSWQMNDEYFDFVKKLLMKEEIQYSYAYHYYLIFSLMVANTKEIEDLVKKIDLVFNVYDNKWKSVYYFVLSKKFMYSKYELAYECINTAVSYLSGDVSTKLSANIYYVKSYIEDYLNFFIDAKESNRIARKIYDEHSAYKFSLTCDVDYGILLNNNGEYRQAKEVLEQALKVSKRYFPEFETVINLNLCANYMYLENYEACIEKCYEEIKKDNNSQYISYYLINSLFQEDRREECIKCINQYGDMMKSTYYKLMIEYIKQQIKNKDESYQVLKELDDYSRNISPKMRTRVLYLLIDYEEERENYQKVVEYYKELVEIIKEK